MIIEIQGIKVIVSKKRIKNYNIHVMPPDGQVTMSAPLSATEVSIERIINKKINWIKAKQKIVSEREPQKEKEYISGEIIYIWGKAYILEVEFTDLYREFLIEEDIKVIGKAKLSISQNSTRQQRENYIYTQLSPQMEKELHRLISIWEPKTGLHCRKWYLKNLKTKWGVYHRRTNTISINIQLVNKPIECLEYIVVHELGHIKIHNHGKDFYAFMDTYLPNWRELRELLCKTK